MDKGSKEDSTLAVIDCIFRILVVYIIRLSLFLFSVYVVVEACSLKGALVVLVEIM